MTKRFGLPLLVSLLSFVGFACSVEVSELPNDAGVKADTGAALPLDGAVPAADAGHPELIPDANPLEPEPDAGRVRRDASEPGAADASEPGAADASEQAGQDAGGAGMDASQPQPGLDAGPSIDSGPGVGQISGVIRVDNFGWRTTDPKTAAILGHGAVSVELHSAVDNSVVATYTSGALQAADEDSGDQVSLVDFSAQTAVGDYYLFAPSLNLRSYAFRIADDVYDVVGAASIKAFYYQRCNHDKALPYASDALGSFAGIGGQWVDGACHVSDSALAAGPGSTDDGTLDLHGGWHDAGDYQKTLWGRGIPEILFAYEMNPGAWTDGQLNIPESGNGVPDILDEASWELDFYVRMQRPDGHFITSAKGHNGTKNSPPSQSDEQRVYFDCTSPSSSEWSGGGVTLAEATGNATLSLAHAAIVFASINQSSTAARYKTAALAGWNWLNGQTLNGDEQRLKAAAASAVWRMDSTQTSAKAVADAFAWDTWDGQQYSVSPGENVIAAGAWHYLLNPNATTSVVTKVKTGAGILVDSAFSQEGIYGGMLGDSGNGWDWSWGSNRTQSMYGANLMMAGRLGALGSHTLAEIEALAQKHLHFMLGLNPLNMVYMTNMVAYGGEHSSFQIYHGWFSYTGGDGDHGNTQYNGKPTGVDEPLYPYYVDDHQTSTYGPAPGIVPGGPNWYYDAGYTIPNRTWPAYAYRDFSVGCGWTGSTCSASSWEITEPMAAYQGPFVLMASFFMSH